MSDIPVGLDALPIVYSAAMRVITEVGPLALVVVLVWALTMRWMEKRWGR